MLAAGCRLPAAWLQLRRVARLSGPAGAAVRCGLLRPRRGCCLDAWEGGAAIFYIKRMPHFERTGAVK